MTQTRFEDTYAYQREELMATLIGLSRKHEPLIVNGEMLLWADEIPKVLEKIRQGEHFSRKERHALVEAGFSMDRLFPGR